MDREHSELTRTEATPTEDIEKIDALINNLDSLSRWLQSAFVVYDRYKEALDHPLTANLARERKLLFSKFPKFNLPFRQGASVLESRLEQKFAIYCKNKNISLSLSEFLNQLNDFIQQKGTGKIGAFKLFDSLNQLFINLQDFKKYLLVPVNKRLAPKGKYKKPISVLPFKKTIPGQRLTKQQKINLRQSQQP